MGDLERIEAKVDWCVSALTALLREEVGWEPEAPLDDLESEEDMSAYEHIAVRTPQRPESPPACPHNQQVLVSGNVQCARCGTVLTASGLRGRDPHSPVPPSGRENSLEHISSKNPGGPLVPHS